MTRLDASQSTAWNMKMNVRIVGADELTWCKVCSAELYPSEVAELLDECKPCRDRRIVEQRRSARTAKVLAAGGSIK
jgi:hypothetical protein